jgi:Skp family chaperone for outer membrane proteins
MKKIVLSFTLIVASTSALFAQGMGHVRTQELLDTMDSRKQSEIALKDMEQLYVKELKESEAALQKEAMDLETKRKSSTPPSATVIKYSEERLQKKSQDLQQREQELQQMLQAQIGEMNKPILERVKKAIKTVAERKKLDFVTEETQSLYSNSTKDITKEVMIELLKLEAELKTKAVVAPVVSPK